MRTVFHVYARRTVIFVRSVTLELDDARREAVTRQPVHSRLSERRMAILNEVSDPVSKKHLTVFAKIGILHHQALGLVSVMLCQRLQEVKY